MAELRVFNGNYSPGMLLADPHVHTTRSDGWWEPERLAEAAVAGGLSAVGYLHADDAGRLAVLLGTALVYTGLALGVTLVERRAQTPRVKRLGTS